IAWTKELFASVEDAFLMFVPTHAGACAKGVRDPGDGGKRAQSQFKCSRQIGRAILVCQCEGLFFTQTELVRCPILVDLSTGGLGSQPLAQVPFIGFRLGCELPHSQGSVSESLVKPKLLPNDNHATMNRSAEVGYELTNESVQFIHVN